jgi:predicted transcriptional regulator
MYCIAIHLRIELFAMDTDTQKLLKAIQVKTGWSESRIAREIGTSQPTVNRLFKGQLECQASTWRAIEELSNRVASQDPD